jgi:hypothetical protein
MYATSNCCENKWKKSRVEREIAKPDFILPAHNTWQMFAIMQLIFSIGAKLCVVCWRQIA